MTSRTKPSGTYLTHLVGAGFDAAPEFQLARFIARSDGRISPAEEAGPISAEALRRLCPARNEIVIARAARHSVQLWGALASGLFYPHGRKM